MMREEKRFRFTYSCSLKYTAERTQRIFYKNLARRDIFPVVLNEVIKQPLSIVSTQFEYWSAVKTTGTV